MEGAPLAETWSTRELPILRAALREVDAGRIPVPLEPIRAALNMPGMQMYAALEALENAEPPYLELSLAMGWRDDHASGSVVRVFERTRRELGTWPSAENLVSDLAAAHAMLSRVRRARMTNGASSGLPQKR